MSDRLFTPSRALAFEDRPVTTARDQDKQVEPANLGAIETDRTIHR